MWPQRFRSIRRDYSRKIFSNPLFERRGERPRKWRARLQAFLILAAFAVGGWEVLYSGRFSPDVIEVSGNERLTSAELQDGVREILSGRRWLIVPNDNLLFLSERELTARLNERFVLESVRIDRSPLERRLAITVVERVSSILMQFPDGSQAALDLEGSVTRLYKPDEGLELFPPLGPNKDVPADKAPKLYALIDDKAETVALREKAVSPAVVRATIELPELIGAKFGGRAALRLHIDGKASPTVRAQTGEGWSLYLDADKSLRGQIDNADLIMRTKVGTDRPRLDYIDVRFGEKVFFKLR